MLDLIEKNKCLKEFLADIYTVAGFLWERGMAERNAGNISANITGLISKPPKDFKNYIKQSLPEKYLSLANNYFFVTATGRRMRDISKDIYANCLILKIADDGKTFYKISCDNFSHLQPTSELPTHLSIHNELLKSGSENKIILHTHPTELIALTQNKKLKNEQALNKLLWCMHPETIIVIPEGIGFIPYILPGTKEIAEATIKKSKKNKLIIWEKHGVFSIGKNILEMFDTIDVVNKSASIYLKCKGAGFEPEGLTISQLKDLRELAKNFQ